LKYALRFFFVPIFKDLNVKGIKFRLKGKISVAGNARTRTLLQKTGVTGHATFNNKIAHELSLVRSFTGVMGLKV
jgi:ribosomal protein S3